MSTIRDVAKYAGVSVATVSRVINQPDNVSDITRKKVNKAITALHYSPYHNGQDEVVTKVLVIVPNRISDLQSRMIDGIQATAEKLNIHVLVAVCHNNEITQEMYINQLRKRSVEAIIFLGTNLKEKYLNLLARDYPIGICGEYIDGIHSLSVTSDVYKCSYDAVTYMIKKGFRRIGMISSLTRIWSTEQKEAGYMDALRDNGIVYKPEYIFYSRFYSPGNHAYRYFESLEEPPNAIFSISDYIASSIISSIQDKYNLGENYAVVAFDNTIFSQLGNIGITSVEQDLELMGQTILEELLVQITNPSNAKYQHLTIPSKIVLRQSTGDNS